MGPLSGGPALEAYEKGFGVFQVSAGRALIRRIVCTTDWRDGNPEAASAITNSESPGA
jgi:hypothetical protein